jgi:hypothetical protein
MWQTVSASRFGTLYNDGHRCNLNARFYLDWSIIGFAFQIVPFVQASIQIEDP